MSTDAPKIVREALRLADGGHALLSTISEPHVFEVEVLRAGTVATIAYTFPKRPTSSNLRACRADATKIERAVEPEPGQRNTYRKVPIASDVHLFMSTHTGPPTWWRPTFALHLRKPYLRLGWLRGCVIFSLHRTAG